MSDYPFILALRGVAGAGKTTIADHYRRTREGVWVIPFAKPLKEMLADCGVTKTDHPEQYRRLAQVVGTDLVRDADPHYWVRKWCEHVREARDARARLVIADDCRFVNEAARADLTVFVRRAGHRGLVGLTAFHPSEAWASRGPEPGEPVIENSGEASDLPGIAEAIDTLVRCLVRPDGCRAASAML